jgi:hypothetical protein
MQRVALKQPETLGLPFKLSHSLEVQLPPLPERKFKELREKLQREGLRRDSFVVNAETNELVDGYRRARICMKYGIPITEDNVIRMSFKNNQEILECIHREQIARRELDEYSRIAFTIEVYWDQYEAEGRERMLAGIAADPKLISIEGRQQAVIDGGGDDAVANRTVNRIAGKAGGCGASRVREVRYLMLNAPTDIIERVKNEDDELTIHEAYELVRAEKEKQSLIKPRQTKPKGWKRVFHGGERANPVVRSLKAATKGLKIYMRARAHYKKHVKYHDTNDGVSAIILATQDYLEEFYKWKQQQYPTGGFAWYSKERSEDQSLADLNSGVSKKTEDDSEE